MMVMNDITAKMGQPSVQAKTKDTQSSITPFQKILEKEEKLTTKAGQTEKTEAANTDKVAASSDESESKAEVTLDDIFKRASEKYDISYDFLTAVAKAESDFNTKCVSSAGAKGIMQLMPDECKEFKVTDPYDAEQNIMAAAKLLKAHLKKFDGDFTLAAAAYNAGSGAVKKYGGVPPYKETQNYVKKINKYMKEGVTVPDRTVSVANTDSYTGSGGSTGVEETASTNVASGFDAGKSATDEDLQEVMVAVGSGQDRVTMTYGAYLRYLELGSTGVG
ncbi:MAG: lytic transglycosylase domain-containing protein [Eubacterium sp.]|nr:lytic transglycosylase domain-containing protein [Eubacterium sp.]